MDAVEIRAPGGSAYVSSVRNTAKAASVPGRVDVESRAESAEARSGFSVTVSSGTSAVEAVGSGQSAEVETGILLANPYSGGYEADALFREQVFQTAHKTMRDDFTVHAINYTEAPNDTGITVTIGG